MNYATIKYCDIANGPGIRTSLFVSGCTHRCEGCFNEIAWDFDYGEPFTPEIIDQIIKSCESDYVSGLTILGGEPMEPINQRSVFALVKKFKRSLPQKTIWCYSGYTYEEDMIEGGRAYCEITDQLLGYLDVIVDGEFMQSKYDISLRFMGSSNQRIIDLKKTIVDKKLSIWQDKDIFSTHTM